MSGTRVPRSGTQRGKTSRTLHVLSLHIQGGGSTREEGANTLLCMVRNAHASGADYPAQEYGEV